MIFSDLFCPCCNFLKNCWHYLLVFFLFFKRRINKSPAPAAMSKGFAASILVVTFGLVPGGGVVGIIVPSPGDCIFTLFKSWIVFISAVPFGGGVFETGTLIICVVPGEEIPLVFAS